MPFRQVYVVQTLPLVSNSNPPWSSQFQYPKQGMLCKAVEFDDIKVFYHLTQPDVPLVENTWNFYIAHSGASTSGCIDWAAEGIDIKVRSMDGRWGECGTLLVSPGARVRIFYTFRHKKCMQEIVFPENDPPIRRPLYLDM